MRIRLAVKENQLSDPSRVTDADCAHYLTQRGKGWVGIIDNEIAGFAIADLQDNNVWALFVDPEYEGRGVGKALHSTMLDWYFRQRKNLVWLSTSAGTRAEVFYRKMGWQQTGICDNGEVRFEMTLKRWKGVYSGSQD